MEELRENSERKDTSAMFRMPGSDLVACYLCALAAPSATPLCSGPFACCVQGELALFQFCFSFRMKGALFFSNEART